MIDADELVDLAKDSTPFQNPRELSVVNYCDRFESFMKT